PVPVFLFSLPAPAPPAPHTLSLHDALPIYPRQGQGIDRGGAGATQHARTLGQGRAGGVDVVDQQHPPAAHAIVPSGAERKRGGEDRKSTRLNSSHVAISYAVFCLKKKKQKK